MDPTTIRTVLAIFVILYSVILHEVMHAWTAWKLGDPTGRNLGRITLNPIPHIDPFMTILLPIVTALAGIPFGGAKPVPITASNFRRPARDLAISAAAGPLTNLGLAALFLVLTGALGRWAPSVILVPSSPPVVTLSGLFLFLAVFVNLLLGLFNFLPIPPLDGSRVLYYFLPPPGRLLLARMEPYGLWILVAVIFLFRPILQVVFAAMNLIGALVLVVLMGPESTETFLKACFRALQ